MFVLVLEWWHFKLAQTNKPFAIPSNGVKSEQSLNGEDRANVGKSETVQNMAPKIMSVVAAQNNKTNAWYLLFERPFSP